MIITIGGPPGSGKTTVGRLLAEKMEMDFISTGMIFRDMAAEKGMTLAEFGKIAAENHEIDKELDRRMLAMAKEKKDIILEGRLAAHMLHLNGMKSFKVWIDASIDTRAGRISGREEKPFEIIKQEMLERERCEWERYKTIYNIDLKSLAVYNHVVHSDSMTPDEVVNEIIEKWEAS